MAVTKADEQQISEKGQQIGLSPEQLIHLIQEIKKPYVDEAAEAQKKVQRAAECARIAGEHAAVRQMQEQCRHIRRDKFRSPNLNGQRNCKGEYLIICGECGGAFLPGDPQYAKVYEMAADAGLLESFSIARQAI